MGETTLISTFYSFPPFVAAVTAYSPSRIILVLGEKSLKRKEVMDGLKKVDETYSKVAKIERVVVPGPNLVEIAKMTAELLESLKKEDKRVIVNISGGWKLLSQGVLYGCYARPGCVDKIVCNNIEDEEKIELVELPKFSFGLKSSKKDVLLEISKRNGRSMDQIAKALGKKRGVVYQHLKKLREMGYVDEKFEITVAGRLALI